MGDPDLGGCVACQFDDDALGAGGHDKRCLEAEDRGLAALGQRFGSFEAGLGCGLPPALGVDLKVVAVAVFQAASKAILAVEVGLRPTDGDGSTFVVGALQEELGLEGEVATAFATYRAIFVSGKCLDAQAAELRAVIGEFDEGVLILFGGSTEADDVVTDFARSALS